MDEVYASVIKFVERNFVIEHFFYTGLSKLHNSSLFVGTVDFLTKSYYKMGIDISISNNTNSLDNTSCYEIQLSHHKFDIVIYRDSLFLQSKINSAHYEELSVYRDMTANGNIDDIKYILGYST